MAKLLYFVNKDTGQEYVIIETDGEPFEEYLESGYVLSVVADIGTNMLYDSMPTNRSLKEG